MAVAVTRRLGFGSGSMIDQLVNRLTRKSILVMTWEDRLAADAADAADAWDSRRYFRAVGTTLAPIDDAISTISNECDLRSSRHSNQLFTGCRNSHFFLNCVIY